MSEAARSREAAHEPGEHHATVTEPGAQHAPRGERLGFGRMGTRADFYIGRGTSATWLGSIAYDGDPDGGHTEQLVLVKSESDFETGTKAIIASLDHGTTPDQGWPWPWETSHTTVWAYMFENGAVWVSRFGDEWVKWADYDMDVEYEPKSAEVPDMSDVQVVTMGRRSGVITVRG